VPGTVRRGTAWQGLPHLCVQTGHQSSAASAQRANGASMHVRCREDRTWPPGYRAVQPWGVGERPRVSWLVETPDSNSTSALCGRCRFVESTFRSASLGSQTNRMDRRRRLVARLTVRLALVLLMFGRIQVVLVDLWVSRWQSPADFRGEVAQVPRLPVPCRPACGDGGSRSEAQARMCRRCPTKFGKSC
jgi:hypothetical protein